ncbi:MAG TPA: T9SS type A sorting domain-containing protein, partial [Paludibacter sp.]|nr:T9SS type A sorting domain-containing protein [Paludibacter sp.]
TATKDQLSTTMWYRTHDGTAWKYYTYIANSGIGIPASVTNLIPPMQAFWVLVNAGQTGTLSFTNAMRAHQDAPANMLKAPAAKTALNQILRLQVAGNSITDESLIYFNDNAANGFDMYDSPKMMNGAASTVPDMYTTAGTEQLVINGMNNIPYNTEISLYFKANASTAGTFTLKASEISNFEEGTTVYIKNNLTQDQQLISDGSDYTFVTSDAVASPAFSLIFKAPGAVTGLANADSKVLVYANANRQITVTVPSVTENATVSVYNAVGQKLYSSKVTKATTVIDNAFAAGVYVVNVNNVSKKVIIK